VNKGGCLAHRIIAYLHAADDVGVPVAAIIRPAEGEGALLGALPGPADLRVGVVLLHGEPRVPARSAAVVELVGSFRHQDHLVVEGGAEATARSDLVVAGEPPAQSVDQILRRVLRHLGDAGSVLDHVGDLLQAGVTGGDNLAEHSLERRVLREGLDAAEHAAPPDLCGDAVVAEREENRAVAQAERHDVASLAHCVLKMECE